VIKEILDHLRGKSQIPAHTLMHKAQAPLVGLRNWHLNSLIASRNCAWQGGKGVIYQALSRAVYIRKKVAG